MTDNKPFYTDDELIIRIWDVENIRILMGLRSYYNTNEWRRRELNELWVTKPELQETASFGRNWGYYVGMNEISNYYVVEHEKKRHAHLDSICSTNPDLKNCSENLSIGCCANHPISTGLIELAGDGQTARGLWYCVSQETISKPDDTADARWIMEKMAADLIKEDDNWKIWHIVCANDFSLEAGEDYSQVPVYPEPGTDPVENEFGEPTIKMLTHDSTFNWWDDYPAPPKPYFTFNAENSYGPEGFRLPSYR